MTLRGSSRDILNDLARTIDDLLADCHIDRKKVLGVGMTFPGLVDDSRDMLIYWPISVCRISASNHLNSRSALQVFADNEAQAAANAERISAARVDRSNLVYISIAEGIGAGNMIDHKYTGAMARMPANFGHVRISDEPVPLQLRPDGAAGNALPSRGCVAGLLCSFVRSAQNESA
jgi:predicted NBD/HSP70 family sugar kinase